MCGINGFIHFNETKIDQSIIKDMNNIIKYRGPDQFGYHISKNIALGHRRLKVIDLKTGKQPIYNEAESTCIIFNGEIYNYLYLKKILLDKGHKFYTNTDTEVILHLYEEYKEKCVEYLRGMFAFAIYDSEKNQIFIARDRLGKKPVFYTFDSEKFIFSSEIKPILVHPYFKKSINYKSINHYLSFLSNPGPETVFNNINKLEAGHYLILDIKKKSIRIKKYWDLGFKEINKSQSFFIKQISKLIDESVKIRLVSDVPLGAFLSGGIDSSAIVAYMSKYLDQPVKTFTISFNESSFDESKYARIISEKFGTDHHEFSVDTDAISILPKLAWHFDEPFADSSAIPSYYVSRETRKHVTVALNGDGGDENLVGYPKFVAERFTKYYNHISNFMRVGLNSVLKRLPESTESDSKMRMMKRFVSTSMLPSNKRYFNWIQIFNDEMKDQLYSEKYKSINMNNSSLNKVNNFLSKTSIVNPYNKQLYTDIKLYLESTLITKMERASMMNSLEVRSPLLDHKLIEFCSTIPFNMKMKGFQMKYLLKQSLKPLIPKEILNKKKQGFSVPIGKWFRSDLKDLSENVIIGNRFINRGLFKKEYLKNMLSDHYNGKRDNGHRIYTLIMLEYWYQTFIDRDNISKPIKKLEF